MLRLLIWRLGLAWWNLLALLEQLLPGSPLARLNRPVGYFAFGANLDPAVLTRRRMRVLAGREILLRDHVLHFNQAGPYRGFGFASVEAAPGRVAYGKILTLGRMDARRMDYYELTPILHKHRKIWVEQDGERFFFYQATCPKEGLRPTREYLDKILYAANRSAIIPEELLNSLRNTPVVETLEPNPAINFVIRDYHAAPAWLAGLRRRYDLLCVRLFQALYSVHLFDRFIRPQVVD